MVANVDFSKVNLTEKKKTPVLLYHGTDDEWPVYFARASYETRLKDKGIDHFVFIEEKFLKHDFSTKELKIITEFF